MSDTTTPNYHFDLPTVGASQDTWGGKLNANWTAADSAIHGLATGYLPLAGGGQINGNLTISPTSGYALLTLNKSAGGNVNEIVGSTTGHPRWALLLGDAIAESGSNAGSNFSIYRFDDGGIYLGTPLSISRATGNVTIEQSLNVAQSVNAQSLTSQSVTSQSVTSQTINANGQVNATTFNCASGIFYVDGDPNYYLARNASDGGWRFVEGGTVNSLLDPGGNLTLRGSVAATTVTASVNLQTRGGNTILGAGSTGAILQFQAQWFLDWNSTTGDLVWRTPAGELWHMRVADAVCYNALGTVGGFGAYWNMSDARGKQDVADSPLGLAEILRLRPVTFKRTSRANTELGFIAQELREVIPEAVVVAGIELPDGMGGIDSSDPTLATTLDPIVATLVNAIKELTARVADLESLRLA